MARHTACFALSAVLLLATMICPGNGELPPVPIITKDVATGCLQFPGGQFPSPLLAFFEILRGLPPMRIISKGNTSLSITADDKGEVLLAPTNCGDAGQLWVKHSPIGDKSQFVLVNVNLGCKDPLRAMQISDKEKDWPVKLAPYNPLCVPSSMLWAQDAKVFGNDFHKIRSVKNSELVLDGLLAGDVRVHSGTVVGAYPARHDDGNVLWKTPGFLFNT